jgi:hypothetical protein
VKAGRRSVSVLVQVPVEFVVRSFERERRGGLAANPASEPVRLNFPISEDSKTDGRAAM